MVLGNAIIGVLEGWLLAKIFKLSRMRCILVMIFANYVSAWLGWIWLNQSLDRPGIDIHNGLAETWRLIMLSYMLTFLVEWPFVTWCFRGNSKALKNSFLGNLIVQTASYFLLFAGFYGLSGKSLYSNMTLVSPQEIAMPPGVILYYISDRDGQVYSCSWDSEKDTKVAQLAANTKWECLELRESTISNAWDLVVDYRKYFSDQVSQVVLTNISTQTKIPDDIALRTDQYHGWGQALRVGVATNSDWDFSWAHWPVIGVMGRNDKQFFRMAFETPFGGWSPYRVIHLPGDKLIVQLGVRQICIVDPLNRKIALLRKGHGPLALLKEQLNQDVKVESISLRSAAQSE